MTSPAAAPRVRVLTALPGRDRDDELVVPSQRGRMLDAITAAVAEKGYVATTVADVISRAGVSRKTFYEHFKNKEDCYLAAFKVGADYVLARLLRGDDPAQDLERRSAQLLSRYTRALAESPLAARAFIVEVRAAGATAQESRSRNLDRFAALFSSGDGATGDVALEGTLRAALMAAVDEIVSREILAGRTVDLPALEPQLTALAVRVLGPRPTRQRRPDPGAAARA